ncbi:MAG TPA: hypothetical protein VK927_08115, partial [Adhaeribacter sp.]|nr:hypothetical protein [Adhaeribacter sp.]
AAPWIKRTVSLAGQTGTIQIRFRGIRGTSFTSDMAIDDFKIYNIPPIDAELVAITAPAISGCGFTTTEDVTISIKNNGNTAITSIPVRYQIGTNPAVNETAAVNIAPGATAPYTFTTKANLATPGTYNLTTTVLLTGDGDPSNDVRTRTITVVPNVSTFPYNQNFESGNGGWVASGTNSSWALGTPTGTIINSAASGSNSWVTNLSGLYNASEDSRVLGPCFNFSSLSVPIIEMKIWWNSEFGWDGAVLQSSINGGATWQTVGNFGDPNNWYNDNSLDGRPGGSQFGWGGRISTNNGSGGWVTAKRVLTGLGGQSSVLLRIAFGSDGSIHDDGFAFDDVAIYESPANDVGATAIISPNNGCGLTNQETVTISVKNFGSASQSAIPVSYSINAGTAVNEVMPGPLAPNATANYTFTTKANLSAVGTFVIEAKTNLTTDGIVSNNAFSKSVTNIPVISTLPYSQNFENGPGGWTTGGTNSSWALGTPTGTVINSAASGNNAWVTNLSGNYSPSENSFVVGPCFNFSGIADPDFEANIWWNSEAGWDGAVLQSSIDGGATWQNVGTLGAPNNWFNDASLDGRAGGQDIGWAGNPGSGGWVKAKHKLTGLGGQSAVLLRFAFGSDGSVHYDGFGFDDVRIGDNTGNLSVNSFVPLTKICGFTNNEKVEVVIENQGSVAAPAGSYSVEYRVDNGAWIPQPGVVLAPGVATNFLFTTGADLSAPGAHTIDVRIVSNTDPDLSNNEITYSVSNATIPSLPIMLDFETPATGTNAMRVITQTRSNVTEGAAAARSGATGMIMDGVDNAGWVTPVGVIDPWTNNLDHHSAVYMCFNPSAGGIPTDSLWLSFDLKQLFKTANANTNFRVTVNGVQV